MSAGAYQPSIGGAIQIVQAASRWPLYRIPDQIGQAIDSGFLDSRWPHCGVHGDVYMESGACMICDARVGAAGAVETRQQLGDDAGGGRL